MRKLLVLIFLVGYVAVSPLAAQTWSELFEQKQTQEKYLLLQIGALKVQSELLADASRIFQVGLGMVSDWKEGEFLAHRDFFEGWKKAGPQARLVLDRMEGKGLLPEQLIPRIRKVRSHWDQEGRYSESHGLLSEILQEMEKRCLELRESYSLLNSSDLEMEDAIRAELLIDLERQLKKLAADLSRVFLMCNSRLVQEQEQKRIIESNKY
ncbi:hypothetical protein [uncultured Algoriphagus sp.]|uniref:hypothetical protein n=1 Tax=uncultured Algoriphagus sp. TaxID=417365 RepID=UPI002599A99B|nr:hypothetical protein [uncultured Algoriphagus sp.]